MEKLKGNQNVRKTAGPGNGQFAKETERNDPERVVETDPEKEDYSDWMKAGIEVLTAIEDIAYIRDNPSEYCAIGGTVADERIDVRTIALMKHCQALKRVDR